VATPEQLILPSLEIRGYRGIRALKIDRLGRANLVVGKNNVGKTSFLEALALFAQPGNAELLVQLLGSRDELYEKWMIDGKWNQIPIQKLFYGRTFTIGVPSISIGPSRNETESLTIGVTVRRIDFDIREGVSGWWEVPDASPLHRQLVLESGKGGRTWFVPVALRGFPLLLDSSADNLKRSSYINYYYIESRGMAPEVAAELWDRISLTPRENDVVQALHLIAPEIERLALQSIEPGAPYRIPTAKLQGEDVPEPLRSLGDGVNRLFGIALAMVNAEGGLLLVDEIENGVHYSVQADLWRLLFKLAARHNVQVFATTHSWDMVKAFQLAASESEEEGVLIRLAQKAGQTIVAEFDERDLEVVVEGQIEVR
jgi:hypothetical protein